ncbi:MAG: hypothetical protein CMD13_04365 [Flavobacteriales bacterium]|nr:hypothetical protein [Flavobacteriales bacterium]
MKYYKISEYLYLAIGSVILIDLIFFKESIFENPLLVLFCILSFGMYFFRRYFRTKFNKRNKD